MILKDAPRYQEGSLVRGEENVSAEADLPALGTRQRAREYRWRWGAAPLLQTLLPNFCQRWRSTGKHIYLTTRSDAFY